MPQITTSGIVSGIDVNGIVEQLVAAERAPKDQRLAQQEFSYQTELSAIGSVSALMDSFVSRLDNLQDTALYEKRKVSVTGEGGVRVSADESASPANYAISVDELAAAEKIASKAYSSNDDAVGSGDITITSGSESFTITLPDEANSLSELRDAINAAEDNDAVYASIVTDEDGPHLLLTAKNTGLANTISVVTTADGDDTGSLKDLDYPPTTSLTPMVEQVAAKDSQITLDGFVITSSDYNFEDAIDGISIDLSSATKGESSTLDISLDKNAISGQIRAFASAYNSLITGLNSLSSFDAETGVSGPLQGDALVNQVGNTMRSLLGTQVDAAAETADVLAEIGFTTNFADGTLSVDTDLLNEKIDEDLGSIINLFTDDSGIAQTYLTALEPYTNFNGIIDERESSIERSIDDISSQRESLDLRMVQVQSRYQAQFLAMDRIVSELLNTGSFLTQQLDNLPGFTRDNN